MATPRSGGAFAEVRLTQIPKQLRLDVAFDLARRWRLSGMDYALFMLAAESPVENPSLLVDVEKAELVLSGKRPLGGLPKELAIPPATGL